jgi:hypothetical protein
MTEEVAREVPDADRLREIRDLLRHESSIAFYSSRAKESMLMLLAEAHLAAEMRQQIAEMREDVDTLKALRSAGVDSWEGYDFAMELRGEREREARGG